MMILPGGKFTPLKIMSELRLSEETMPGKYQNVLLHEPGPCCPNSLDIKSNASAVMQLK